MALDLAAILTAAGTGAVTGYLTNNLALKMIFKEYGPFGGVVVKTRDEFIESISKLIEKDLINHQTLKTEFSRAEFEENFEQSISDFLNIYLKERSSQLKLNEIPGWAENYQLLASSLAENSIKMFEENIDQLKEEKLEKILPQSELEKIIKELYPKIITAAKKQEFLEEVLLSFYDDLKSKNFAQLLSEEMEIEFKNFIKKIICYFRENYQDLNTADQKEFKEKLKALFDLENLAQNLIGEVKNIKAADLFKEQKELEELKEQAKIKEILREILLNFKIEIDNSNLTIGDLLDNDLETALKSEIIKLFALTKKEIIEFLNSEEKELNSLIFAAVEAEIEVSTGLKGLSRRGIYSKYQENIEQYGLPTSHLKEYLNENLRAENQELITAVMAKIKKIKVKNLKADFVLESKLEQLETSIWNFYQQNYNQKIIDLFSEDIFAEKEIESKIVDLILSLLQKITAEEKSVDVLVDSIFKFKLEDIIKRQDFKNKIQENSDLLYDKFLKSDFFRQKGKELINNSFFTLLNNISAQNSSNLSSELKNYFNKIETELSSKKLNFFYQTFKTDENTAALTNSIKSFFYNNLPQLIEGKVAEAAASNLQQLSDQEVEQAIEDFMGKELKPITYLGALLGAAAGILFSFSGVENSLLSTAPLWANYLSSALLYGGVGWLTNVLAIWMIFHPYREKSFASFKLPFTPGVVAKNRARFADSMGKFVEKEILKADSASKLIENNRSEIKNSFLNYFKEEDYQKFFHLIRKNKKLTAEKVLAALKTFIKNTTAADWNKLLNNFGQKLEKSIRKNNSQIISAAKLEKYLEQENFAVDFQALSSYLSSKKLTSAAAGEYKLSFSSQQLKKVLKNKEVYPFIKFIIPQFLDKGIKVNSKEKILNAFAKREEKHLKLALDALYQQQEKAARLINFKKDEIIAEEKAKENGFFKSTLISGALYAADLDEFIDSVVKRIFARLKEDYFVEKKAKLKYIYSDLIQEIKKSDLLTQKELELNQILSSIFRSKKIQELVTELIYLSEDKISAFLDKILKENNRELFESDFKVNKKELDYFIDQHLGLEQKLKLLLELKDAFSSAKFKKQLLKILKKTELQDLKAETFKLLLESKIFKQNSLNKDAVEELKENITILLEGENGELILAEIAEIVEKAALKLENGMNRDSIKYLTEMFMESAVDSLKYNSEALLNSLELQKLTAEEVKKMDPAEIEAMFDSFAGKYFTHLKHYGWFGGIFGLLQLLLKKLI